MSLDGRIVPVGDSGVAIVPLAAGRQLVLIPLEMPGQLQGLLCIGSTHEYLVYPQGQAPMSLYERLRASCGHGSFLLFRCRG